ncbi:hypothetical protein GGI05_003401 [Coemansia sp. RSA 2603]|nr:hypothetical protein GGI05_003401 [Coemansia sp. RSA 2603]
MLALICANLVPAPMAAITAAGTLALVIADADHRLHVCGYSALKLDSKCKATLEPFYISSLGAVDRIWAITDHYLAWNAAGRIHS